MKHPGRPMSARFRVGLTLLVALLTSAGHAATLLISNPDGALSTSNVADNDRVIGVVGDYVNLDQGEHELRLAAPRFYSVVIKLVVSGSAVRVTEAQAEPGNCHPHFETVLEPPSVTSGSKKKGVARKNASKDSGATELPAPMHSTLSVNGPTFGNALPSGACSLPSMMGCTKRFAVLGVDSSPRGAEVWIDDKRVSVATKATLSVPFCVDGDRKTRVLMRMPDRVTCYREIAVQEGVRTELSCELPSPK